MHTNFERMKRIRLNVSREHNGLQTNIYYVCDKSIIISQLNLTISYKQNVVINDEILEEPVNSSLENETTKIYEEKKKQKKLTIKFTHSNEEVNSFYFHNVINSMYNYIFENKVNNLLIGKDNDWNIFINICLYSYSPYIYDHVINVINVHLSLLLIPFCYYDFDDCWFRCVDNYKELLSMLSAVQEKQQQKQKENQTENQKENQKKNQKGKDEGSKREEENDKENIPDEWEEEKIIEKRGEVESCNVFILGKEDQNRSIILTQIENSNFDLFMEFKKKRLKGVFKRLLIDRLPFLVTIKVNEQFIYVVKFVDYKEFHLCTQNKDKNMYNHILKTNNFLNFKQYSYSTKDADMNHEKKFDMEENFYIFYNVNMENWDKNVILQKAKATVQFYYNHVFDFCAAHFTDNNIY